MKIDVGQLIRQIDFDHKASQKLCRLSSLNRR